VRFGTLILLLLAPLAQSRERESAGDDAAAYDRIATCVAEVENDFIGLDSLPAICPGFDDALAETGYTDFITQADAAYFDRDSLQDLHAIATRYRQPSDEAADRSVANLALLPQVLEQLDAESIDHRPPTWGERLRRWLDTLSQRAEAGQGSWLARWLSELQIPPWLGRSIVNTAIVLVLAIAIAVIVSELRAAMIFRRGGTRPAAPLGADPTGGSRSRPVLADVAAAPPRDRPALLLRMLVDTLVATARLHTERTLTHGELARRAAFDTAGQRASFRRVAAVSERILYGNQPADAAEIDAVVLTGAALHEQLLQPKGAT
jgi:hypothetical protein